MSKRCRFSRFGQLIHGFVWTCLINMQFQKYLAFADVAKTGLQIKPTQIVLKRRDWNKKYSTGIKYVSFHFFTTS